MHPVFAPSPQAPVRSRYFTVRFSKSIGRFFFSRRMVWLLIILVSLVVLLFQYENWNGARELLDVRARMIARAGTDDYRTLLPAIVPEEDNFFAIPVIKSWRIPTNNKDVAGGYTHRFPGDSLLPERYDVPLVKATPGRWVLDLTAWEQKRVKAGKPLPAGQTAASVISGEIGDTHGSLPQLIAGLDRPSSQIIPCRRACLEASHWDVAHTGLPALSNLFGTQEALALHLRTAALTGNAAKTRDVAGVMLRLGDAFNDPSLLANLCSIAINHVTLQALNEALGCGTLTDGDLSKITSWLATTNDVTQVEFMFRNQLLSADVAFENLKTSSADRKSVIDSWLAGSRGFTGWQLASALSFGPSGWLDSNHAFCLESMLLYSGGPGDEGWRAGEKGAESVARRMGQASVLYARDDFMLLNPRRSLGTLHLPSLNHFWERAAENLFRRRCAILTCALCRHDLVHGSFPSSLAELDNALLPSPQTDPAKEGAPMGYKRTEKGFLLWSVGDDRNDDGGNPDKDWLWSHAAG